MEMLIMFQNPEFRCHLIPIIWLQRSTWRSGDGQLGPASTGCFQFKLQLKPFRLQTAGASYVPFWSVNRRSPMAFW